MSLYASGSSSKQAVHGGRSEFEILRASHKFLREDEEADSKLSWDDKLAKKYYDNLYREYAVCDLKHYKSGNFALRWRTESEVISGVGETTCGNTRCVLHDQRAVNEIQPSLKTLELPFSYTEDDEAKFALVKVVLCDRCLKKLMWKRNKEREDARRAAADGDEARAATGHEERVTKKNRRGEEEYAPRLKEEEDVRIPGLPEVDAVRRDGDSSHSRRDRDERRSGHRSPDPLDERSRRKRDSRSRSPTQNRSSYRPRPA